MDFFFLVFVHVVAVVGWWLAAVERLGGGGLWSGCCRCMIRFIHGGAVIVGLCGTVATASVTTAAAVSASAIAHGLRREARTKATMAVNSVGRPIIIKGAEVGVIYILVDALLEEVRVAEWEE